MVGHRRARWAARLTLLGGLAAGAAIAGAEERQTLTGDWGGRRTRLADRGLMFDAIYTYDFFSIRSGGIATRSETLDNTDLIVEIDAEKLFHWPGTTFFLYGLGNNGGDPSAFAGDAQAISNIAAPDTWKVYEFWAQVDLAERLSLLAGLYDVNSEFDVIESARLFLNSSFGIGADYAQSGRNGPSIFPTTSLGGRIKFQPSVRSYLQGALLDGVPGDPDDPKGTHVVFGEDDGLLLAGEIGWLIRPSAPSLHELGRTRHRRIGRREAWEQAGKLAAGGWFYTRRQDDLLQPGGPVRRSRSWGAYLLAERKLLRERADSGQGLEWFARVGVAASEVNRFESYVGGGVVYTGLIPGRDRDLVGLGVAAAFNGSEYEAAQSLAGEPVESAEVTIEATYLLQPRPWLAIQPDLQYVINPGTDPELDNALAVALRLTISL